MLHFEWDERKNRVNEKKHSVDFETAQLVFYDPFWVTLVRMKEGFMRKLTVKKMTNEKRRALEALAKLPDEKIDFPDIPEIREFPSDRVIGKYYRPRKTAVTIRLDSDVLAWLKASGGGYQTRINDYLRQRMRRNRTTVKVGGYADKSSK